MPNKPTYSNSNKKNGFVILSILALMVVLFIKSRGISNTQHQLLINKNAALVNLDYLTKNTLLELKSGLELNFDNLVAHQKVISKLVNNYFQGVDIETQKILSPYLRALVKSINHREVSIETFKSHQAIFNNSNRYIQFLSRKVKKQVQLPNKNNIVLVDSINHLLFSIIESERDDHQMQLAINEIS
ncbi:MAG: hypothetical protein Q9M92_17695 [Enterobacterales bacterium]|nr:hypothetical protein [Enterobacterales bacterium]